ncbi:MAG: hypothetical protein CW341_12680 [Bacteroidetes bacterium]|nr:hypothetical protein [Bacteroidota bacterium]
MYNKFELKERALYGNGTKSCYHYDILLRMDTLWSWNGTASHNPMQAIAYKYDGVGNITNITNSAAKVNGIGGPYHVDYTYDGLYRMTHAEGYHNTIENGYIVDMSYFANGRIQRKSVRLPDISYNSIMWYSSQYSYSAAGNTVTGITPSQNTMPSYLRPTMPQVQPTVPTTYRHLPYNYSFQWDGAGNMVRQDDNNHNMVRQLRWDAENRLQGVKDNAYLSLYQYDANGERTYKLTGSYVAQNRSGVWRSYYSLTNATLYASPYMVATVKGYTKHYYAENERIASRIGDGGLSRVDTPIVDVTLCTWKLNANSAYFDAVAQSRLNTPNYITTHLLDTLYYWKTTHGNNGPDCCWYHPDHLGSASWVTDNNGEVVQYLYYLPWGEDFYNMRRNGYAGSRYTFSAKEKDTETGYSYFGSRYYSSDLSIWLSVDPMSDKYPSLSPYVYCANNPIKLVDPNGETFVGVDGESVEVHQGKDGNISVGENASEDLRRMASMINSSGSKTAAKQFMKLSKSECNIHFQIVQGESDGGKLGYHQAHDANGKPLDWNADQGTFSEMPDYSNNTTYKEATITIYEDVVTQSKGQFSYQDKKPLTTENAMVAVFAHESEHNLNKLDILSIRHAFMSGHKNLRNVERNAERIENKTLKEIYYAK